MGFDPAWHPEGEACGQRLREHAPGLGPIDWLIIGGSGIGRPLLEPGGLELAVEVDLPLVDLGLPAPTVPGHGASLVIGTRGSKRVAVQTGRVHPYEGHSAALACAPLGALLRHGTEQVLLTAAVGAVNPSLRTGTIVSLADQIALLAPTPLRGPAFVDCSNLYDRELRRLLRERSSAPLPEAIYAHARGPQYESPAEVAALRALGADVVGMSTTYEAILAAAHRVPCCGLAVVTNAAGDQALSHQDVELEALRARARLIELIRAMCG